MYRKVFSNVTSIKHSTSANKYCCFPFCPDIFMDVHFCHCIFVITFLASMLAHFCNAFLIRFSDFRHGIILKFAGTVSSRSPLLKATDDIFSRHTAFVCGGNPCSEGLLSHVQFLVTVPNLQAGAHGILDPPCATKLRSWMGYQGWSPWRTCNWPRCSFIIQAFWWLSGYYFVICMNNSRNRSPLRIFQYLPISATFVQCGQRRPSWTKHVNRKISSGALSGMRRLIDEIRSFKCVCLLRLLIYTCFFSSAVSAVLFTPFDEVSMFREIASNNHAGQRSYEIVTWWIYMLYEFRIPYVILPVMKGIGQRKFSSASWPGFAQGPATCLQSIGQHSGDSFTMGKKMKNTC